MENKIKTSQTLKVTSKRKLYPSDVTNKSSEKDDASKIEPDGLINQTDKKIHRSRVFKPSSNRVDHGLYPLQDSQLADIKTEIPDDTSSRQFVPVTTESIQHVLADLKRLELESRLVLLVFDDCFTQPGPSFDMIKSVVEPVVGYLDSNCILIKTSLTQLMSNISEADAKEYRIINQAYVICPKGAKEEDVIKRASERNILYGIMTFGCIFNSLKKQTFLVKKEALIAAKLSGPTEILDKSLHKDDTSPVNEIKKSLDTEKVKKGVKRTRRRRRNDEEHKSSANIAISNEADFDIKLAKKVQIDVEKSDLVSKILPELAAFGDVVLKVDNLPGELTMSTLNIILGCHTLKRDQVIGVKWCRDKLDVIDAHIVIQSGKNETEKILSLHDQKTTNDARIQVQRTDFKSLESYILKNHSKIIRLEAERTLPYKVIGYGETNPTPANQQTLNDN